MRTGPRQIAERVMQALEAAEVPLPDLPATVAGSVLIALGSSAAEYEELAHGLAGLFRSDLVAAVESAVQRALLHIGHRPGD